MRQIDRIHKLLIDRGIPKRKIRGTIASVCGITYEAARQWEETKNDISLYHIYKLAEHFKSNWQWLAHGIGDMNQPQETKAMIDGLMPLLANNYHQMKTWDGSTPIDDDETEIDFYKNVEGSAGRGQIAEEGPTYSPYKLRFSKSTLRRMNVQPENANCITVHGNSMEPQLPDGSTVGINLGDNAVRDGKLYAINHDGLVRIKVLYNLPGGGLRLHSYNSEEHPDEKYSLDEIKEQNIQIIGRVFWSSVLYH